MKVGFYSDLHFELGRHEWKPRPAADVDVLVVAGDVFEGDIARGIRWTAEVAEGRPSVFVPGNHEFWGCALEEQIERGLEAAALYGVTMLDGQGWVDIGGCLFAGGTLWTDRSLNVPFGQRILGRELGEPIDVRGPGIDRRAKPADGLRWHRRMVTALEKALGEASDGRPRVVATHHAPSARSLFPGRETDPSGAFAASDLEHLLAAGADLWIHGHVHHSVDLVGAGGTRIVCNPFGYHGSNAAFDERKAVEVGEGRSAARSVLDP